VTSCTGQLSPTCTYVGRNTHYRLVRSRHTYL
jgi:hypothetical protein